MQITFWQNQLKAKLIFVTSSFWATLPPFLIPSVPPKPNKNFYLAICYSQFYLTIWDWRHFRPGSIHWEHQWQPSRSTTTIPRWMWFGSRTCWSRSCGLLTQLARSKVMGQTTGPERHSASILRTSISSSPASSQAHEESPVQENTHQNSLQKSEAQGDTRQGPKRSNKAKRNLPSQGQAKGNPKKTDESKMWQAKQ